MGSMGIDPNIVYLRHTQEVKISTPLEFRSKLPHNAPFKSPVLFFPQWDWFYRTPENEPTSLRNTRLNYNWLMVGETLFYYWKLDRVGKDPIRIWDVGELLETISGAKSYYLDKYESILPWNKFVVHVKYNIPRFGFLDEYPIVLGYGDINRNGRYVVNPNLKELGFHYVMEGQDVWQTIEMWLSREKPVPGTTDSEKTKLLQHGMDKTSFRRENHPSKPRSK